MPSLDHLHAHALGSAAAAAAAGSRQAAFQALRPVCSELLQSRTSPAQLLQGLEALAAVLPDLDAAGLAGCWDYVMFPLLLVVDSIASLRAGEEKSPPFLLL